MIQDYPRTRPLPLAERCANGRNIMLSLSQDELYDLADLCFEKAHEATTPELFEPDLRTRMVALGFHLNTKGNEAN